VWAPYFFTAEVIGALQAAIQGVGRGRRNATTRESVREAVRDWQMKLEVPGRYQTAAAVMGRRHCGEPESCAAKPVRGWKAKESRPECTLIEHRAYLLGLYEEVAFEQSAAAERQ
jgi:hypothetical protein